MYLVSICNSPKLKTTQIFIKSWMDKQTLVYTHDEILSTNKKTREQLIYIAMWMNLKVITLSERSQTKKRIWINVLWRPYWITTTLVALNRNFYNLRGFKQKFLPSQVWRLEVKQSRCWQRCSLHRGSREDSCSFLPSASSDFGHSLSCGLELVVSASSLLLCWHCLLFLFSSLWDITLTIRFRAHLGNPGWSHLKMLNSVVSAKNLFLEVAMFTGSRD